MNSLHRLAHGLLAKRGQPGSEGFQIGEQILASAGSQDPQVFSPKMNRYRQVGSDGGQGLGAAASVFDAARRGQGFGESICSQIGRQVGGDGGQGCGAVASVFDAARDVQGFGESGRTQIGRQVGCDGGQGCGAVAFVCDAARRVQGFGESGRT